MSQSKKLGMELPSIDDIFKFSTGKDGKAEMVVMLSIDKIDNFPNHPFKVRNDDKMEEMVESIKENGILYPIVVRPKGKNNYELVSGHRRKFAARLAGKTEIPAIVKELSDDEAIIFMVDSNLQREEILPSERAFAYKMKLEALKNRKKDQGATKLHLDDKSSKSRDILSKELNESRETIRRYIRLTELIPELLRMVDEKVDGKIIALRPAVELSYLKREEQKMVYDSIMSFDCTPSHTQAIQLRNKSKEGELNEEEIENIISIEKPNQKPKIHISEERFESVIPKKYTTAKQKEDFLLMCAQEYNKRIKLKQKSLSR